MLTKKFFFVGYFVFGHLVSCHVTGVTFLRSVLKKGKWKTRVPWIISHDRQAILFPRDEVICHGIRGDRDTKKKIFRPAPLNCRVLPLAYFTEAYGS